MTRRARSTFVLSLAVLAYEAGGCGDDSIGATGGGGSGGAVASTSASAATTGSTSAGGDGGGEAHEPLGLVFEGTPADADAVPRALVGLPRGATHLEGDSFIVHTCMSPECFGDPSALTFLAQADDAGDFLIEPVVDATAGPDPAAEVNAYFHFESFLDRFRELGFPGLDEPAHVILDVWLDFDGDGEKDEFFAGATDVFGRPGIVMGTVGDRNLAYDPDVFGHEFTHIVTGVSGDLSLESALDATGPSIAAGALREGTADFFAASFMDDPEIGEYSTEPLGAPYFSSVDNDASCPLGLVGEAHADGQVWSGALWEIRAVVGADLLEQVVFDVLRELPIRSTLPAVFAALRERLAPSLDEAALGGFDDVVAARGIELCRGVAPLEVGTSAPLFVLGREEEIWNDAHDAILAFDEMPAALQFRIDVPADVTAIEIDVVPAQDSGFDPELATVHARANETVAYTHDGDDASVDDDASTVGVVRLDAQSTPALNGFPIFVSITYAGEEGDYAFVRVRDASP